MAKSGDAILNKLANWPKNRERVTRWVLFALHGPAGVLGWLFPILACVCMIGQWRTLRFEETGVLTAIWKPKFDAWWGYSTTLGRGIMYSSRHRNETKALDTQLERHEHVHVKQYEDMAVLALIIGLVAWAGRGDAHTWWMLWITSGLWVVPNFVTAWLRGGHPYRDAEHERSAYAQCDLPKKLGESWQERRERQLALITEDHVPIAKAPPPAPAAQEKAKS